MYSQIDELVEAICHDECYLDFLKKEASLKDQDIQFLLNKQQMLQEDYLRLRQYENYISIDETKEKLKDVKKEITNNSIIQSYYQSYYQFNDLLEDVTKIVFHGISHDLEFNKWM